ncbi:hypothetical protein BYT27DRAFT_7208523 [Phlegmacium glaucopus]|nr:hypothetical protein BYT27DRAFT_7208523 [Phlegmacium glaucopus]
MGGNGCSNYLLENQPENSFWLGARDTPGPPRKHVLGWALGHSGYHPNTSRKLSFLAGIRDTTRIPTRKDGSGCALGIQPHIFWPVLGILSQNQPENWGFGDSGYHLNTSQNLSFLAGIRDTYHPNTNQKLGVRDTTQQPEHPFSGWLFRWAIKSFGSLPEMQNCLLLVARVVTQNAAQSNHRVNPRIHTKSCAREDQQILSSWLLGWAPELQQNLSLWTIG